MKVTKKGVGRLLVWLGVLAWVPYILLAIIGRSPSMVPFLAIHLTGVIGGSKLRRSGESTSQNHSYSIGANQQRISNALLLIGILIWAPYFLIKSFLSEQIQILPFLIIHLSGIIGGMLLRYNFKNLHVLRDRIQRLRNKPLRMGD